MLEIVRAVERNPRVLLLDEATSALGDNEVAWLAERIARLRNSGAIVLFISHRWDEIVRFCNRVAILRNGELVSIADTEAVSEDEAVRLMTGQEAVESSFPDKLHSNDAVLLSASRPAKPCAARRQRRDQEGRNPGPRRPGRAGSGQLARSAVRRPRSRRRLDRHRRRALRASNATGGDCRRARLCAAGAQERRASARQKRGRQHHLRHSPAIAVVLRSSRSALRGRTGPRRDRAGARSTPAAAPSRSPTSAAAINRRRFWRNGS